MFPMSTLQLQSLCCAGRADVIEHTKCHIIAVCNDDVSFLRSLIIDYRPLARLCGQEKKPRTVCPLHQPVSPGMPFARSDRPWKYFLVFIAFQLNNRGETSPMYLFTRGLRASFASIHSILLSFRFRNAR